MPSISARAVCACAAEDYRMPWGNCIYDESVRITRDRGAWKCKKGIWILPTYHPAALLRDESKKRDAWDDMKKLKAKYEELCPESGCKAPSGG